jgi:putative addiction module killer protein
VFEVRTTAEYDKWLASISEQTTKARIAARVLRLTVGNPGDSKSVGDGIRELRIHLGPGYRIYYQQEGQILVVLLCGGDKSTQTKDIQQAKQIAAARKGSKKND